MPAPPQPESPFPFDVGTVQVARTLIRLHQLLRGEQLKHRTGEEHLVAPVDCEETMRSIEALLAFMRVDFDPTQLKPRRARPRLSPLRHGEIRAGVLESLKRHGGWQTYNELADDVLERHKIELSPERRRHFLQKLREGVHALKAAGAVVCERPARLGESDFQQRWKLSAMFD